MGFVLTLSCTHAFYDLIQLCYPLLLPLPNNILPLSPCIYQMHLDSTHEKISFCLAIVKIPQEFKPNKQIKQICNC